MFRLAAAAGLLLLLGAFEFVPPHKEFAKPAPQFKAEEFFLGRTEGKGTIKGPLNRHTGLVEIGVGKVEADGTLVLDQRVQREGHPVENRQWRIRKQRDGRYAGTISDAKGPITAEVNGNCLHLKYVIAKGSYGAEQYVYLQPGGRVAINRMIIRKFGITVATVEETIRKVG
jgi:hypothetical protein